MSERYPKSVPVSPDNPAIEKDEDICANCSHCLAVCAEEIGVAQPCKVTGADDLHVFTAASARLPARSGQSAQRASGGKLPWL